MPVIEPAIRPPSEAQSFLLQVTTGCSANHCTFCGAYKGKPFAVKPSDEIYSDIDERKSTHPGTRRVFLMDGDALVVENPVLVPMLKKLGDAFPGLTRVSSYANGYNITRRTSDQLRELYEHKLRLIYIGLESGCQAVLDRCRKVSGAEETTKAVIRSKAVGIKSSVIVLLGLGGREHSGEHVEGTIEALNRMQPDHLSFLSLMLIPGTEQYDRSRRGGFTGLSPKGLLRESRDILSGLELERTVFRSDHASNYLALEGRLPRDKKALVRALDLAIKGEGGLRPDLMRGL